MLKLPVFICSLTFELQKETRMNFKPLGLYKVEY